MSPALQPRSVPQPPQIEDESPRSNRHGCPVLPPIVPPMESMSRNEPHSVTSTGRPGISRSNSISSEQSLSKMQHILNPTPDGDSISKPPTPDDSSSRGPLPPISITRSMSSEKLTSVHSPFGPGPGLLPGHRLSATNFASPTGTIDARKSPFLPTSGSLQGPQNPPVSTQASAGNVFAPKPGYPFPGPHGGRPRRGSDAVSISSRNGSPTPSYSSYGASTAQCSPHSQFASLAHHGHQLLYHGQPHPQSAGLPHPHAKAQHMQHPQTSYPIQGNPMPGQAQYQMMTIETEHGPIQVPVDVRAASKMADEKRRRNAGASARFRQRRKEKEREAAGTISKLESRLRELGEEREFYRMERDYFRDIVYKNDGARQSLVPRMPSPGALSDRKRQDSLTSSKGGTDGGFSPSSGGASEYKENGDRGSDDGRIMRRRINSYENGNARREQPPPSSVPAEHQAQQQQQHQQRHENFSSQAESAAREHQHQQHRITPHARQSPGLPPPISTQHANDHYHSYPTPDSRVVTPDSASLHPMSLPLQAHQGPYEPRDPPGRPLAYETGWAAR